LNHKEEYIELDEVMRQEEDSGILYNASSPSLAERFLQLKASLTSLALLACFH
jgi:hypothetical protein